MHFGNSAGNFGGSAVRRPVGYDSAAAMSKLVALLPNYMKILQNWSEKGVVPRLQMVYRELLYVYTIDPRSGDFRDLPMISQ